MKMDKHELETFKIEQMFIGSSKDELIALGEKRLPGLWQVLARR